MTDHDAIAARMRQDRMSGTMLTGPVYIKLADMADAYLDLYDEVQRLRAERDRFEAALGRACQVGGTTYLVERAEKAEAERVAEWNKRREAEASRDLEKAVCATFKAERDALRAHPYLPAEEIAAIERGNRRWHGEYDTTVSVRWEPYKPDGQRQMKAKGRWQTMTHNGSGYFRWENCDRPAQVRQALKGQTND